MKLESSALKWSTLLCSLTSIVAACGGGDGEASGTGGNPSVGTGGAITTGGTTTSRGGASAGGSISTAGTPSWGGTGFSGAANGGGLGLGGAGSGGAAASPFDCTVAPPDSCPLVTGISFACKQRFALGMNYAWRNFGADFGGLAKWSLRSVSQAPEGYAADLAAMKASGASVIRWWIFPDFRGDGITFDAADDPTGLAPTVLADVPKALELAAQAGLYLVPTIFSFDGFRPKHTNDGIVTRGMSGLVENPLRRAMLMTNVVRPLARAAGTSPHVARLIGWDIINEPEWAIEPSGQNVADFEPSDEVDPVPLAAMKALISETGAILKEETPRAFRSVGWAAAKWSWAATDLQLDVNQPHIYGWVNQYWPYTKKPSELGYPLKPTIMGEFYLAAMPFSDAGSSVAFSTILESFYANGYAGAWPWQHADRAENLPLLRSFATIKGCSAAF